MALTLFPPQQRSHDILVSALKTHSAALDSSITGSGKTVKAVEIARSMGLDALVVCPKAVVPSWISTFEGQDVDYLAAINYELLRAGNTPYLDKTVSYTGRGKNRRKLTEVEWTLPDNTMLIFDECHRCKAVNSINSKLLIAATRQGVPRLMLSATAADDPSEMRALGYALGLHKDTNFVAWARQWGCTFNPWRKLQFPQKNRPKLAELHDLIYPSKGHKISREEMGAFFTETSIITDPIDLGSADEMQALFNEMETQMDQIAARSDKDKGDSPLTRRLRARQSIEMLRIPVIAELIESAVDDEHASVAVFLNFRDSMSALADKLSMPVTYIHGDQNEAQRKLAMQEFQDDSVHVIICQIDAGGVGVNLHDSHGGRPRQSIISPTDDAKMMVQALGRIDRANAQSDTVQRIVFAAGTIEEQVAKNFRRKLVNMNILHKDLEEDGKNMKTLPNKVDSSGDSNSVATPTMTDSQPKHAKWGPSGLKHIEICPGFKNHDGGVNPVAEMGTRIHDALEHMNLDVLTDEYERLIGERCLEAYGNIIERHGWPGNDHESTHEIRLDIDLGNGVNTFGTCDVLLVRGNEGISIDWKTGRGAIDDASINTQAQAYTLGAFQKHPELETIHFYFVIPQRDEVTFHTYTREDCDRISLRLSTIIARAEKVHGAWEKGEPIPIELLNPQPGNCEFCANQWRCHAVTEKAFDILRKYGTDGLPVPDEVHGSATDDPAEMAKLLLLLPVIEKWANGIKARSRAMAFDEGTEIPGFNPVERAGKRTISSAGAAWDAVQEVCPDVTLDEFIGQLSSVSFNKIADVVADNTKRGKKTAAKNELEDKLLEMGVLEQSPPSQFLGVKR